MKSEAYHVMMIEDACAILCLQRVLGSDFSEYGFAAKATENLEKTHSSG